MINNLKGKCLIALFLILVITGAVFLIIRDSDSLETLKFRQTPENKEVEFLFSDKDNTYLAQLRNEFKLEEIIKKQDSDLEKVLKISHWVHNLWQHDGKNVPPAGDPISILRDVQNGIRYRCVEYSIVISGCLNALGIPSRVVGLKTRDVETRESGAGHVVCEVYLYDLEKWIMVDGQWDAVPALSGIPLNSVEFQKALRQTGSEVKNISYNSLKEDRYYSWIGEYLYYFDARLDQRYINNKKSYQKLMLVPQGAKKPEVFQKTSPIKNVVYTDSVADFYKRPAYK